MAVKNGKQITGDIQSFEGSDYKNLFSEFSEAV